MDIEILAFDVFGTLTDWRSSIAAAFRENCGEGEDWPAVADAWRRRYAPALARVRQGGMPFQRLDALHRTMLGEVAEEFRLDLDDSQRAALVRAWHRLTPWPDVVRGLERLGERHIRTTLSNGGVGLLTRLARFGGMAFDCVLSAELARTYKPDPRVYALVPDFFEVPPERVMMVACHPGDLEHAARAGLRTGYVRRPHEWGPDGAAPPPPAGVDVVADDLIGLAAELAER